MQFQKKRCVAMLLAGGQGSRLMVLTENTAKPAVPFGGKYRIIDFPLSNCANSGIDVVGVLTQYQPRSLNEHIGLGRPWDLDRTTGDEVIRLLEELNTRGVTLIVVTHDAEVAAQGQRQIILEHGRIAREVTDVASPEAWQRNPELVLRFYNERRRKLWEASPNRAHIGIAQLEKLFDVQVVTQNVDDLHEQAGSSHVLHLHGELRKARSTADPNLVYTLQSPELNPFNWIVPRIFVSILRCRNGTPFGIPVLPEVRKITPTSSGSAG